MEEFDVRRVADGATIADAHSVRRTVFVEGQDVPESLEIDGKDQAARHVVVYDEGDPVATGRLREDEPGIAKIERVAVLDEYREEGYGRAVMYALEDLAREADYDDIVLHAQVRVEGFYRRLGYESVGEEFEEAGIPHVEMWKSLGRDSWTC